ncbi:MAG TPA: 16S rRNA (cytosine(1402)-N(4))-methyltransferase RsmH [Acidobacteriota bacterium]|nr:16S rRNA (cytosine(1402)-N(4))-methyltransferase RsmH [Acidobacteriota bacterium]
MRLHKPVLAEQAVSLLNCKDGGFYVDCTLGMGGHAEQILKVSSPRGRLLGMDRDRQALEIAGARLKPYHGRYKTVHGDYKLLSAVLEQTNSPIPDGILADLGPSLLQFTSAERGFSFQLDGPLDMRMNPEEGVTAADILNTESPEELQRLFRAYGEEPAAKRIAQRIVAVRASEPIRTTSQLTRLVESVVPRRPGQKIHPATRTFQALRIAVNQELEGLDAFLFDAFDALADGGRLVIIAFHSLEDRIVKRAFQFLSVACRCPKSVMSCQCGGKPLSKLLTRSAVMADEQEIAQNPASRSARLRCIEKLPGSGPAPRNLWEGWLRELQ